MSRYDIWKTASPPEYDFDDCDEVESLGKTKHFPDGSTLFTDENGNHTVIGKMAHDWYFEMMRMERENV